MDTIFPMGGGGGVVPTEKKLSTATEHIKYALVQKDLTHLNIYDKKIFPYLSESAQSSARGAEGLKVGNGGCVERIDIAEWNPLILDCLVIVWCCNFAHE